jgi:hypothetical protein
MMAIRTATLLVAVLCASTMASAQPSSPTQPPPPVIQISGVNGINASDHSIVIKLTFNNSTTQVVNSTPSHFVKQADRALRNLKKSHDILRESNELLTKQMQQLREQVDSLLAARDLNSHPERVRELQTAVEQSTPLQQLVTEQVQQTIELQTQVETLSSAERAEANEALENADLDAVRRLLYEETHPIPDPRSQGFTATYISSNGSAQHTVAAGLELHGPGGAGAVARKGVGLNLNYIRMEWLIGATSYNGSYYTFFNSSISLGPWLRLGAPHSFVMHLYYYCPVIERAAGQWRFPLVGAGVTVGFAGRSFMVNINYRVSTSQLLYEHGYLSHLFGLSVSVPYKPPRTATLRGADVDLSPSLVHER